MNIKIELPISEESKDYLKRIFKNYKETQERPVKIDGRCVIHMYPIEDTNSEGYGESGFCDAFNCELHIYDCKNNIVYKTRMHDEIDIRLPSRIRIFKDLSTMIIIDEPVLLGYSQAFTVYKRRD